MAFELFRREGFDYVTVNDVAAAAGVSRSTFLRYFGSKAPRVRAANVRRWTWRFRLDVSDSSRGNVDGYPTTGRNLS